MRNLERLDLLECWVDVLEEKHVGAPTIHKAHRVLRAILNDALRSEVILRNRVNLLDLPAIDRPEHLALTPTEVIRLAGSIHERFRTMVLMAAFTGLRWADIAGLRVEDLELTNGFAIVSRSLSEVLGQLHAVDTKNHKPLRVGLPPFLCHALDTHLQLYASDDGTVFTSKKGGPLRRNVYARDFKPAVVAAGLNPSVTFHDLRRTAASLTSSDAYVGAGPRAAQGVLGHSSKRTTMGYIVPYPADFDLVRDGMERVYGEAIEELSRAPAAAHLLREDDTSDKKRDSLGYKKAG